MCHSWGPGSYYYVLLLNALRYYVLLLNALRYYVLLLCTTRRQREEQVGGLWETRCALCTYVLIFSCVTDFPGNFRKPFFFERHRFPNEFPETWTRANIRSGECTRNTGVAMSKAVARSLIATCIQGHTVSGCAALGTRMIKRP